MRAFIPAVLVIGLAACAAPPKNDAPAPARQARTSSLLPGTIGAVVVPGEGGVRVEALASDGPAARGGLELGDVIVRCANAPVTTVRDFNQRVVATRPGERLRLDVRRKGEPLRLEVDVLQLQTALRP